MANYQQHLESSRQLEQAFQGEVEQAQNAEVKSFYQKLASEQRTITNQLQSKVNTAQQTNVDGSVQEVNRQQMNHQQANQQANHQQANANQQQAKANEQQAKSRQNDADNKNA